VPILRVSRPHFRRETAEVGLDSSGTQIPAPVSTARGKLHGNKPQNDKVGMNDTAVLDCFTLSKPKGSSGDVVGNSSQRRMGVAGVWQTLL